MGFCKALLITSGKFAMEIFNLLLLLFIKCWKADPFNYL